MAENIPNLPGGAVPPKPETSKIQPKKETVRINLPPKPSAAPTIKLPTLPPGGPAVAAPAPLPPPPTSGARAAAPAPATQSRPAAQRPPAQAQRQVAVPRVSGLDTGLAIAAAVVALVAVGVTAYFIWGGVFAWAPPA
jgi:hypothetical protein